MVLVWRRVPRVAVRPGVPARFPSSFPSDFSDPARARASRQPAPCADAVSLPAGEREVPVPVVGTPWPRPASPGPLASFFPALPGVVSAPWPVEGAPARTVEPRRCGGAYCCLLGVRATNGLGVDAAMPEGLPESIGGGYRPGGYHTAAERRASGARLGVDRRADKLGEFPRAPLGRNLGAGVGLGHLPRGAAGMPRCIFPPRSRGLAGEAHASAYLRHTPEGIRSGGGGGGKGSPFHPPSSRQELRLCERKDTGSDHAIYPAARRWGGSRAPPRRRKGRRGNDRRRHGASCRCSSPHPSGPSTPTAPRSTAPRAGRDPCASSDSRRTEIPREGPRARLLPHPAGQA